MGSMIWGLSRGDFGNLFLKLGPIEAQRSGFGRWCDIRVWRFHWWRNAKTGQHIHFWFAWNYLHEIKT